MIKDVITDLHLKQVNGMIKYEIETVSNQYFKAPQVYYRKFGHTCVILILRRVGRRHDESE